MNLNDFRRAEPEVLKVQTLKTEALNEEPVMATDADANSMRSTTGPSPYAVLLGGQIGAACERIAPVWPLDRFVAVNPFHGLRHETFEQASVRLRRIAGARMYMPRAYYREQIAAGRISEEDLREAAARHGVALEPSTVDALLNESLEDEDPAVSAGVPLLTAVLESMDTEQWSVFVVDRISQHCAAYFDMGQATWKPPWQGISLYASWRCFAERDFSLSMMGLDPMRARIKTLPEAPQDCIGWALHRLGMPDEGAKDYMHAALIDIGGWAAWTRLLRWEKELAGGDDETIVELLAVRLAWDALLYEQKASLHSPSVGAKYARCSIRHRWTAAGPATRSWSTCF
ncbi:MAG: putative inorganic carbon transporter subunit DabA, partial [Thiohalocapsa sp.]